MSKQKTHKGAQKRFKVTKSGKAIAQASHKRHILTPKPTNRKRQARNALVLEPGDTARVKRLMPYA